MKAEKGDAVTLLLVAVIVFTLTVFISYRLGYDSGEDTATNAHKVTEQAYKDAEIKLREDHAKKIGDLIQSHYKTNLKNTKDHDDALSKVQADLAASRAESKRLGGLRIPAPTCPRGDFRVGTQATGTSQRDEGTSTTVALPEQIEADLWSIVGQADELTEQLRACQAWIKSNGFYGER